MDLIDFDPAVLFDKLRHIAEGDPDGDDSIVAWIGHHRIGGEDLARALRRPSLDLLRALVEMVVACARPEWGEPTCYVAGPEEQAPDWFEPHEYASGVPHVIHYLAGWNRPNDRIAFLWIGEDDVGACGVALFLMMWVLA
jgi:hypothetical protein